MNPLSLATRIRSAILETRALNPQPLPPKAASFEKPDPIGPRALNPQPLPPRAIPFEKPDPIGPRALNPQPLPPAEAWTLRPRFRSPGEIPILEATPARSPALAPSGGQVEASRVGSLRDRIVSFLAALLAR